MKPFVWSENMTVEESKDGAYWERNMMVLWMAIEANFIAMVTGQESPCGWYVHGEYEGWSRVISLHKGKYTFHIPDNFEIGNLEQIEPNWNGHSTEEKWEAVMDMCGVKT